MDDLSNLLIEELDIQSLRQVLSKRLKFIKYDEVFFNNLIELYPVDIEETLKVANEVREKIFLFRMPFDMERTSDPFQFDHNIDWEAMPNKDPEWCFMLNRHRYWIPLVQAGLITKDHSYIKAFEDQISDWIDKNGEMEQKRETTCRLIEAGLRMANWLRVLYMVVDHPSFSDAAFEKMMISMHNHGAYLASRFTNFNLTSNHGIIENHGLYLLSTVLDCFKESSKWRALSEERLLKCIKVQIYEDGLQWEQSTTYHIEVLMNLYRMVMADKTMGCTTNRTITETVSKMAHGLQGLIKPNGHQPLNGDSDDMDIKGLVTLGAYLLNDELLKYSSNDILSYDDFWSFGLNGNRALKSIAHKRPSYLSKAFDCSHNYIMRSSWSEDSRYLRFSSGSMGGGHGHSDLLHFDVFGYGRDFLVDSGRYTYRSDSKWREYFKNAKAHNTLTIDGEDFSKYEDTWLYSKVARPRGQVWISESDFDYVEASHDGYLNKGIIHTRKILFIKPYLWIVMDQIDCQGSHTVERYFNFEEKGLCIENNKTICTSYDGPNLELILASDVSTEIKIVPSFYSPEYNMMNESERLVMKDTISGSTILTSVIHPYIDDRVKVERLVVYDRFNNPLSEEVAEGFRLTYPNNIEFILMHAKGSTTNGIDVFIIDNIPVLGEMVLIKKEKKAYEIINIK